MEGELNLQLLLIYVLSVLYQGLLGRSCRLVLFVLGLPGGGLASFWGCPTSWEQSTSTGQAVSLRMELCSGAKSVFVACIAPKGSYLFEFVSLL